MILYYTSLNQDTIQIFLPHLKCDQQHTLINIFMVQTVVLWPHILRLDLGPPQWATVDRCIAFHPFPISWPPHIKIITTLWLCNDRSHSTWSYNMTLALLTVCQNHCPLFLIVNRTFSLPWHMKCNRNVTSKEYIIKTLYIPVLIFLGPWL